MRGLRKLCCLKVVLICSSVLQPCGVFGTPAWTAGSGNVSAVYSHNGVHFIQTSIADAPCGTAGMFWWPTSDPDAKDMFALALSAYLAGKRLRVVHDLAAPSCSSGANLATHVLIAD
jgi:hypothetical protein